MNLVKDVVLELPLPTLIVEAQRAISAQLRDFTRLGPGGLFETVPEYPPFAWQEAVVNAVCPTGLLHLRQPDRGATL